MLWNFSEFNPDVYTKQWCMKRFGKHAHLAEQCYRLYYQSFVKDADKNTRYMLDGEVNRLGRRFTGILKDRFSSKRDMLDNPQKVRDRIQQVEEQLAKLDKVLEPMEKLLATLEGEKVRFFEENFVSWYHIMRGLLVWLDESSKAGLALEQGQKQNALDHLQQALDGMNEVRKGQRLTSQGHWQHFYRGDRKMNLDRSESLTKELVAEIKKK